MEETEKKQTCETQEGKLCWDLSPDRQASGGTGLNPQVGLKPLFMPFWDTSRLCIHALHKSAAVCRRGAVTAGSSNDFAVVPIDGFETTLPPQNF